MTKTITATADELVSIRAACEQNNLQSGQIETAISAHDIPAFNTPRGQMVRKADVALLKLRSSTVSPL